MVKREKMESFSIIREPPSTSTSDVCEQAALDELIEFCRKWAKQKTQAEKIYLLTLLGDDAYRKLSDQSSLDRRQKYRLHAELRLLLARSRP